MSRRAAERRRCAGGGGAAAGAAGGRTGTDFSRKIIVWSKTGLSVFTLRIVFWRASTTDDGNESFATTTGSAVPFSTSTGLRSRASMTWTMIW